MKEVRIVVIYLEDLRDGDTCIEIFKKYVAVYLELFILCKQFLQKEK